MKKIELKYQKLTQIEHILKRPGMYIGDINERVETLWIYNKNSNMMEKKEIKYSPGLYKLFDEIIINALDETTRDLSLKMIKVNIDKKDNYTSLNQNHCTR